MTTQFKTLFSVTVAHAYYREGCRDIQFFLPSDTAQKLKNGKLLAKELDGKLHVLFEADEAGVALVTIPGNTLRIGLQLTNSFFTNFTATGADFASSELLYRNATTPAALDAAAKVTLAGQVFSHTLTDGARPVTVTLKNAAGQALQTETVTATDNRTTVSYDLTGQASGACTIEEVYPASTKLLGYYSDAELVMAGVFGVLEVSIAIGFYAAAAEFQMPFAARQETLQYYVVATNYSTADFDLLAIFDSGFTEDGRPQINFTKVPSASFTPTEISPDLLGGSSAKVVLFKSQTVVARTEQGRKKIQLRKNGEVLVTHLPQPGPEKSNADMIISVSKP